MLISSPLKILKSKLMMHKMMGFHFGRFYVDNLIRKKKVLFLVSLLPTCFQQSFKMAELVLKLGVKLIAVTANDYGLSLGCAFLIIFGLTSIIVSDNKMGYHVFGVLRTKGTFT